MSKSLATTVILPDPTTGEPVVFQAGDTPDKWAADLITNPKAWGESPTPKGEASTKTAPAKKAAAKKSAASK